MVNTNTRDVPVPDDSLRPESQVDTPIQQETTVTPTQGEGEGKQEQSKKTDSTQTQTTDEKSTKTPQKLQAKTDKDKLVGSGVYMNQKYALVDEQLNEGLIFTNSGKYKISVFLSPKFLTDEQIFTEKQNIFLKYNDVVREINLMDDIDNIGLKGYIEVDNIGSHLDVFLERHNNYYVIINFTQYQDDENGKEIPKMKYQPYIFDIDRVQNLGSPEWEWKSLRIWLVDIVTSILKTHSIASVIKRKKSLASSQSYKEVFEEIMNYVRDYIKVNTNNKYQYHKPLLFNHNTNCMGFAKNGNDVGNDMSSLVGASFKKITKNASIKEAMDILLRDCCTTLKTPAGFKERYMNIGDVLIPFFFKEEYPDPQFMYASTWTNGEKASESNNKDDADGSEQPQQQTQSQKETPTVQTPVADAPATDAPVETQTPPKTRDVETPPATDEKTDAPVQDSASGNTNTNTNTNNGQTAGGFISSLKKGVSELFNQKRQLKKTGGENMLFNKSYGGKANVLINRQMTMRDIYMPFFVSFGSDTYVCVYQDINPSNDDNDVIPLLGVYQGDLKSFQFDPIDMNSVAKLWKNVIFLDCNGGAICANSTLIFFSWFFDYFQEVFLNAVNKPICSNVMPDFFMLSRNEGIKHASMQGDTFENKFDEMNAYTYATQTDDSVKECLRLMGKNLASFTLINDRYTFKVNGNLFRRPNEIIRLGYKGFRENEGMQMLSYHTGLNFNDMTYLYVRRVTHIFKGSMYDNLVQCCKICEVFDTPSSKKTVQKQ